MSATNGSEGLSSSTLWATASKEWVIPAKPKPGRKPGKAPSAMPPAEELDESLGDGKARRTQNRAAQRAFRERKQSHLAELQARIQMYEKGEIQRNSALQNVAKRLKEENETLRKENGTLQQKISKMEAELDCLRQTDNKRGWDEKKGPSHKRSRLSLDVASSPYTSPSSSASPPQAGGSPHIAFSPLSLQEASGDDESMPEDVARNIKTAMTFDPNGRFDDYNCGFCNETTPCVCREVVMQQHDADNQMVVFPYNHQIKSEVASILDNLPAYRPPVPLRRRLSGRNRVSIFPVSANPPPPNCSGDPSNCEACSSDDFGKAFCEAVNGTVAVPCDNCPDAHKSSDTLQPTDPDHAPVAPEMIPCNDAWNQLKLHPNVEFSDLSLLAEVVARRSRCTGPRVVISPAPFSVTPERVATPTSVPPALLMREPGGNQMEGLPSTRLVPEEVLRRCGRERRVRTVHVDAVEAALRLLDAKSSFYRNK